MALRQAMAVTDAAAERINAGKLAPVITVEPSAKEVKAAVKLAEENRRVVKAFKVRLGYVKASAENPVFDRLYNYAESEGLPILFHTGDTAFRRC